MLINLVLTLNFGLNLFASPSTKSLDFIENNQLSPIPSTGEWSSCEETEGKTFTVYTTLIKSDIRYDIIQFSNQPSCVKTILNPKVIFLIKSKIKMSGTSISHQFLNYDIFFFDKAMAKINQNAILCSHSPSVILVKQGCSNLNLPGFRDIVQKLIGFRSKNKIQIYATDFNKIKENYSINKNEMSATNYFFLDKSQLKD